LEVLYDIPILVHKLRARIAEDVHSSLLAEIIEECVGDYMTNLGKVVVMATVEGRDLVLLGQGVVIAQFVNQQPELHLVGIWILRVPLHPGTLEVLHSPPPLGVVKTFRERIAEYLDPSPRIVELQELVTYVVTCLDEIATIRV